MLKLALCGAILEAKLFSVIIAPFYWFEQKSHLHQIETFKICIFLNSLKKFLSDEF